MGENTVRQIRILASDDWEEAISLHDTIFEDDAPPLRADDITSELWLGCDKQTGDAVAFAVAQLIENICYLHRVGVLPEYRGHNIQCRFIRARVRWARQMGARRVVTYTSLDNEPSARNLQKCGFFLYNAPWKYAGDRVVYWRFEL